MKSVDEYKTNKELEDKIVVIGICEGVGPEYYMEIGEFIEVLKSSPDF